MSNESVPKCITIKAESVIMITPATPLPEVGPPIPTKAWIYAWSQIFSMVPENGTYKIRAIIDVPSIILNSTCVSPEGKQENIIS